MSEYRVVQSAQYSPTHCFFCLEYVGPFIDTQVEDPRYGHIYICGPNDNHPGCIGQMAAMFGMLPPEEKEMAKKEIKALTDKVKELEQERSVTLTYDDLLKAMQTPKRLKRTIET
jgi:hypothetical protein